MFRIQIYVRSDQIKFSLLLDVFHFRISEDVKRYELQQKKKPKKPTRNLKERCPSSATKLRVWPDQDIQSTPMLRLQGNLRSVRPSVRLFFPIFQSFHRFARPSVNLFLCPSFCVSVYFVCLPDRLFVPLSVCQCLLHLSYLLVRLFVCVCSLFVSYGIEFSFETITFNTHFIFNQFYSFLILINFSFIYFQNFHPRSGCWIAVCPSTEASVVQEADRGQRFLHRSPKRILAHWVLHLGTSF
jgi:hypothetical protein